MVEHNGEVATYYGSANTSSNSPHLGGPLPCPAANVTKLSTGADADLEPVLLVLALSGGGRGALGLGLLSRLKVHNRQMSFGCLSQVSLVPNPRRKIPPNSTKKARRRDQDSSFSSISLNMQTRNHFGTLLFKATTHANKFFSHCAKEGGKYLNTFTAESLFLHSN